MKQRNNKKYQVTKTQKWGSERTSQDHRRTVENLLEDPVYNPFRQSRSTKNRTRYTTSLTTLKPTIKKIKTISRRATQRPRWNYRKLVAAQAEAHRAAFQEAGVEQAPPPTWSYLKYLADKAAIRSAHRAAFQEAGVDRPPAPTWSYARFAAAKIASRADRRSAFEDSGVDITSAPTWSYRKATARKTFRSALRATEVTDTSSPTRSCQNYADSDETEVADRPFPNWSYQNHADSRATEVADTPSPNWSLQNHADSDATEVADTPSPTWSYLNHVGSSATHESSRGSSESFESLGYVSLEQCFGSSDSLVEP